MTIKHDGSATITTTTIPSTFPPLPAHTILPSDRPEVAKSIYQDDEIRLYDDQDNLIAEDKVPELDFDYLIPLLEDAKSNMNMSLSELLACIRSNITTDEIENLIASPPPGTTIQQMNGFHTIQSSIGPPFDPSLNGAYSGFTVTHAVNVAESMYLGSTLHDAQGNVVTAVQFIYDNCDLIGMVTDFEEILPSGQEVLMSTNTHFSNLIMNIY